MGKQWALTTSWKKTAFVLMAVVIFLLPVQGAYANSAPPPSVVWFSFDYKTTPPPRLLGVQLIACSTANCEQPVLLQHYGTCDRTGCLLPPPKIPGWPNDFGCAANICRSAAYPSHGGNDFKLVAQFSDRVRISEVVNELPAGYGGETAWRVIVREGDLSIEADAVPSLSNTGRVFPNQPLLLFGLSILLEILVAGVCFWWTVDPRHFEGALFMVLLVNLVSLPVVWFFFPSLGRFQSEANRDLGMLVLFLACIYSALLAGIYRSGKKTRNWLIGLTLLSLPVSIFCSLVAFTWLPGYYGRYVSVQGLPASAIIIASEVFAVVFEALLITVLSKQSLPRKWIWMTSLLMNAASFVAGMLLASAAASMPIDSRLPPEPPTVPPPTSLPTMVYPTASPIPPETPQPSPTPPRTLVPTPPPIPTLPPLPQAIGSNICPDTQPSILMPGRKGRVSNESSESIRVRVEAGFQAKQVGLIPPGGYFHVIDGPRCEDSVAWFQVNAENGVKGWMAEGSSDEYWVQPIVSDARNVNGPTIALQELIFTLPEEIGSKVRIADIPYNPETKTPPYSLARLAEYPRQNSDPVIYVYSVEEYLYFRSDRLGDLEQVRNSINSLMKTPQKNITLINLTDSLVIGDTYLAQAGSFASGLGLHAIAMLSPSDRSQAPKPYYVFYGFSSDMKYFVFAKLDVQLAFGQIAQATIDDFKPDVHLLDRFFGMSIAPNNLSQGEGGITACPGAPDITLKPGDWTQVSVNPPLPSRIRSQPGSSGEVIGQAQPGENVLVVDGPRCDNGYTWWYVHSPDGLEGWAAEGDAAGYWLVRTTVTPTPIPLKLRIRVRIDGLSRLIIQ